MYSDTNDIPTPVYNSIKTGCPSTVTGLCVSAKKYSSASSLVHEVLLYFLYCMYFGLLGKNFQLSDLQALLTWPSLKQLRHLAPLNGQWVGLWDRFPHH